VQEKYLDIDGNKIRYLESGQSKKTLVLIHGLGASAERWNRVIPIFSNHYKVIVPDLIGFGLSDKPLVDYTPSFFAEFLGKFLNKVTVEKPSIIGSSLGGQIIIEYACENGNNIEKMILVSPAGVMKQSTPALDAYIMAALYPNEQSAKTAFEMMEASGKEADPMLVKGFIERMQLPNAKMAFMSTVLGLKNSEIITSKLQTIQVPTLVVWGSQDPVIPINYAEYFVSSIRDCRFYRMDDCGHTPYVQDPKNFSKLVLDFLNQ
jgi:pimeloyl-ACP methyl ester carboxylesterase